MRASSEHHHRHVWARGIYCATQSGSLRLKFLDVQIQNGQTQPLEIVFFPRPQEETHFFTLLAELNATTPM